MKTQADNATPDPAPSDGDRRKTLDELIAEQGVAQTASFEHLLGSGAELWEDDADFERFLQGTRAVRQELG
jgi:hypothetical protein